MRKKNRWPCRIVDVRRGLLMLKVLMEPGSFCSGLCCCRRVRMSMLTRVHLPMDASEPDHGTTEPVPGLMTMWTVRSMPVYWEGTRPDALWEESELMGVVRFFTQSSAGNLQVLHLCECSFDP